MIETYNLYFKSKAVVKALKTIVTELCFLADEPVKSPINYPIDCFSYRC